MSNFNAVLSQSDKITQKVLNSFVASGQNKKFDVKDAVIIGLLEEMIGKAKSLKVLIDNSQFDASDSIARTILESFVYLKFILSAETDVRAKAYFFSAKIDENKFFDQLISSDKKGKRIRASLGKTKEYFTSDFDLDDYNDFKELMITKYKQAVGHDDLKRAWFNIDGRTPTLEVLCNKLGMESEYETAYRIFSKDIHSTRAFSRLKLEEDYVTVLLSDKDTTMHESLIFSFLLEGTRMILNHYELKAELAFFESSLKMKLQFK